MIAEIVPITRLPLNLPHLDYLVPLNFEQTLRIGQLVTIPFRNHEEFGIVIAMRDYSEVSNVKLKSIISLAASEPLLSENIINFNKEIADFYRASPGFVLKAALFPLQKRKIAKIGEMIVKMPQQKKQPPQKPFFSSYNFREEQIKNIKKFCAGSGQRLILVPESYQIETIKNIAVNFGEKNIITVTSSMGDKEYFDKWLSVRNNDDVLVIGTRKALWLPWINLSAVFIEDEGNSAYKSWDMTPRYHARDAAIMLAKHTGSKIILSSCAPSVETYYFTNNKIYDGFTSLKNITKPSPIFCNIRLESKSGNEYFIAEEIIERLKNLNKQAFILVNRKGTAGTVLCRDCGFIFSCEHCNRQNAYYKKSNELSCHFCNLKRPLSATCPACHGANYFFAGVGTQGIAEALRGILNKDISVLTIDSDNVSDIPAVTTAKKAVIIGTEYAWPYIDWDKTEIVVLADADSSLIASEYKSTEDLWQTIRKVQLKALPETAFFIQTSNIEHPVFAGVYDPSIFYEATLKERKIFEYPPYNYIIRLYYGSTNKQTTEKEAVTMATALNGLTKKAPDVKILGPIGAFPPYYRGRYWQVLILKFNYSNYKKRAKELLPAVSSDWKIDPNPNNLISIV